jgi:acetyl-CoA C-acetyltransferase
MKEIVILSATRTPIGNFQSALASSPASRLGATAIMGALVEAGVSPEHVTDVLMGNVLQAGQGQAPARQAALYAGLPAATRAVTIHKVCGSGLQAVMQGSQMLATGMGEFVVAGGMENMSQAPYLMPKARDGYRLGHQQVIDSLIMDGLWDPYNDIHMGNCAEKCAAEYKFTREAQDAYAIESFQRANAAQKSGRFAAEITPVEIKDRKGNMTKLKPVFQKDGTITPANASSINDGAAALVLAPLEAAARHGLKPIARLVAFGGHAQEPMWFTTAPVQATKNALTSAGWSVGDVDLWEVNEAFAVVPMAFMRELGVPHDKVNVDGGAIALGHPIGCSGARIIVTLIASLKARGLKRGVAAICIGGGEGLAVCVEII